MANIACGNARLGHGHALSLPLEGHLDLPHPYGVGVLLPHVIAFDLAVLPAKVKPLADALEVDATGLSRAETIAACAEAIRGLYADIGFPDRFTAAQFPADRVREMAQRSVPGLYAGIAARDFDPATATDRTIIACPSARKMTVAQAQAIFERCLA
jgi:alcohol dehydrogenase class IV